MQGTISELQQQWRDLQAKVNEARATWYNAPYGPESLAAHKRIDELRDEMTQVYDALIARGSHPPMPQYDGLK